MRWLLISTILVGFAQCKKDPPLTDTSPTTTPKTTPYTLEIPLGFPTHVNITSDNLLTVEGIALGKKLFYDPILSGDNTQSCGSCHAPAFAFTDNNKIVSQGIDGQFGSRNTPAIVNLVWNSSFFWDGRAASLETQALGPVPNPIEMHLPWNQAVERLQANNEYKTLFYNAFGSNTITKELVANAIAQFERTLISANSPFDKWLANEDTLTAAEQRGYNLFYTEKADCFHCHVTNIFTDNRFHNNGLDAFQADKGLGDITNDPSDEGKFKTPTLRNIALTAPYMHDGRFSTLEEVIDFYSSGLQNSPTVDPFMLHLSTGGAQLSTQEKADLIAFLHTLTDSTFINNPAYRP